MNALNKLKDGYAALGELIAELETQPASRIIEIQARTIELRAGDFNVGTILKEDGTRYYDLIGLEVGLESATWDEAMEFAKKHGAQLGDRRDLALARTNARHKYQDDWHWTNEQLVSGSGYAWAQGFLNGHQAHYHKDGQFRVRLFRRVY